MDPQLKPISEARAGDGVGAQAGVDDDEVKSTTSRGSTTSRLSRGSETSSVKLRTARVKEELANRKREQFLKEQRLRREQFELNERIDLMKIDHEMDNAKVESAMWQEHVDQELEEQAQIPPLPQGNMSDKQKTEQWFSNQVTSNNGDGNNVKCDANNGKEIANAVINKPSIPGNNQVDHKPYHNTQTNDQLTMGMGLGQKSFMPNPFNTTNNSYNPTMMAMALSLPKPDMPTFSGNPVDYWNFVNSFEVNIAERVNDDRLKLSYLIQFTTGKAREAIENCVLLDPFTGYSRARVILQDQFGRNYIVARAHLEKVTNRPPLRATDSQALWDLARDMRRCQMTTSQMGYSADMSTTDTLLKIQHLLPVHLQSKWASRAHSLMEESVMPNFSHLTDFIEESAKVASNVFGKNVGRPGQADKKAATKPKPKGSTFHTSGKAGKTKDKGSCPCCAKEHTLDKCRQFKEMSADERFSLVKAKGLCFNCLGGSHISRSCASKARCSKEGCKGKHHTLLHMEWTDRNKEHNPEASQETGAGQTGSLEHQADANAVGGQKEVCLRVLPVKVRCNSREVITWALLDHGSDVSLCEQRLADELGIKGKETNFRLTTVNNATTQRGGYEVSFSIQGLQGSEVIDMPRVWTVESLPTTHRSIPRQQDVDRWSHLKGIQLPTAARKDVTLLIGSDTPEAFWVQEERRGKKKEPYAIRSPLGWTVMGPTGRRSKHDFKINNVMVDNLLQEQVQRFWELDHALGDDSERLGDSVEDRKARNMMERTVTLKDGHYEMGLPWRHLPPSLPNNKHMAESRLQSLKKRLEKDATLHQKYTKTMTEYLAKGFATEVDENPEREGYTWYLPHHPVTHPMKPEKVRVVFDCAAKSQGVSLNDQLLSGPDYTNKLVGVLMRFRQERIALVADIEAMFHQVKVAPRDTDALRFLWWENGDTRSTPKDYKMQVHLFGATSSPSCAGFALQKTALDNKEDYGPEVCQIVKDNFYVDDCLKSIDSEEEAKRIIPQLCSLLNRGGFRLTKWVSNNKEVIATVPPSERASSVVDLDLDHLPIERTLGVLWNMDTDMFTFKVSPKDVPATRRGILSATSSLYDPLGFVAPFTVNAKVLLQDLCAQGLGWDEKVNDKDLQCWQAWLAELPDLTAVQIGRCFKLPDFNNPVYDLHVFSDASERAYAACVYLRVEDSGRTHCTLVMGKTRLCPLKKLTVPRLELSAAVLAVKLGQTVMEELRLPIRKVTYWTDSTSVLLYIRNSSRRFRTFVANRVAEIQSKTDSSQWRHVDTKNNPADDGSRGLSAGKISRWISGPRFLLKDECDWPPVFSSSVNKGTLSTQDLEDDPEVKRTNVITTEDKGGIRDFTNHYSSWKRLRRGVAWLLRLKACLLARARKGTPVIMAKYLTPSELKVAELEIVKHVQKDAFKAEFEKNSESKEKSSAMRKLNPVLVDGVLRVGGRLDRSPIDFNAKHPMILPSNHHVTRLLIEFQHQEVGHSGAGMTWTALRANYWILKGGSTVRRIIGKCLQCKKRNAPRGKQMMADLPKERVTPDKPPFTFTGVDYFGPFSVKQGRSQPKRYGCIFTCLTTRAVHLEIANSLDTDSFINALRRFVNRRGLPEKIYSDNGTNFRAGYKELKQSLAELNSAKVGRFLAEKGIQWQFNPPGASHMGGVWERVIRSVRKILGNLLKQQTVTDENLSTLMSEVEAILNARPLTPLSSDAQDEEPLTPNHLLLMRRNPSTSPGVFNKDDCYMRRRWRQSQYLAGQFWRRWTKEYLPLLQERQRWLNPHRNFRTDDLVLVADDNSPRGHWPLGRVTMTYPDRHGLVRQVEVRIGSKYYKRPISKLCLLEGDN